jgi:outer membrane protein TolC
MPASKTLKTSMEGQLMRNGAWACLISALFFLFPAAAPADEHARPVTISFVMDGPWDQNERILRLFQEEISYLLEGEFDIRFPADKTVTADFTMGNVKESLAIMLKDSEVDVVIALGPLTSTTAVLEGPPSKPVVAPFVVSDWITGRELRYGTSGIENLAYLIVPDVIERDVKIFLEIVPFKHLAVLLPRAFSQALPRGHEPDYTAISSLGVETVQQIYADDNAEELLERIPPSVDAVYMVPLLTLDDAEFHKLADGLIERRLPSFSQLGRMDVERGMLAGLSTDALIDQRARRVALMVQQILLGDRPEDIAVAIATEQRLSINMATARAIGISPSWEVLNEAELVDEERIDIERRLSLAGAMREAVRVNLELESRRREVGAGEQNVKEARAVLLPQFDVSAAGVFIDEDRAASSFGQTAEQRYSGTASFSQLLFGEGALSNLSVQNKVQRGREHALEGSRLDVALDAALAYLDVLSARALEIIEKENLKLTRENLERARVRSAIGSAGPAEVFRWEAEIAQQRDNAIKANSRRNVAEISLNLILNRPPEEPFLPEEADMEDPDLLLRLAPPSVYADNRNNFKLLRTFMAEEALRISPELKRIDAAIAAQKRFLKSQGWRYYLPTLALSGSIESVFEKSGAGADGGFDFSGLPVEFEPLAEVFPETPDDTNWQIALTASVPLFRGGGQMARSRRASKELERLELERAALAQSIEGRVRSVLHQSGASFASIDLTREAAEAAAKTLNVVSDAYARGAVSILDLLDAQKAALVTEQAAAIAIYRFLADYMVVQRAMGRFDVLASEAENRSSIEQLETYILENGGKLPE